MTPLAANKRFVKDLMFALSVRGKRRFRRQFRCFTKNRKVFVDDSNSRIFFL